MKEDRERAEQEYKVGDWVVDNEHPNRAFKIMDVLQGPKGPPRFYYDANDDAYRASELTLLTLAGRDEELVKAARDVCSYDEDDAIGYLDGGEAQFSGAYSDARDALAALLTEEK